MSWLREHLARVRLWPGPGSGDDLTDILAVCEGNICRAPYIAARLRACLPGLRISSAGTAAVAGAPPAEPVLRALARHGITGYPDVGRPLTRGLIRDARLIITAARIHRVQVVTMDPRAAGKTFTLKELARVISAGPPVRGLGELIARAAHAARVPEDTDYDDDLDDPFGLDWPAYEKMAAEADVALAILVPVLSERVPSASYLEGLRPPGRPARAASGRGGRPPAAPPLVGRRRRQARAHLESGVRRAG